MGIRITGGKPRGACAELSSAKARAVEAKIAHGPTMKTKQRPDEAGHDKGPEVDPLKDIRMLVVTPAGMEVVSEVSHEKYPSLVLALHPQAEKTVGHVACTKRVSARRVISASTFIHSRVVIGKRAFFFANGKRNVDTHIG